MKKIIHKIAGLALGLSLAMGVGVVLSNKKDVSVASAADLELSFDLSSNPGGWPTANSTTSTAYSYTLNSVDYTFMLNNCKQNSGYLMMTQPAKLGLPALSGYKLTKVVAHNSSGCSTKVTVGISSSDSQANYVSGGETQTWSTTSSAYTYNLSSTAENTMYYLYVTTKNGQITSLDLTYEEVGGTQKVLTDLVVSGSMAKTAYTTAESWDPTGLTVTAYYDDDSNSDVTSNVSWSYNPASPSVSVTSVVATATFSGQNASSDAQTVSVTAVPGSEDLPYTVAQARAAIDAGSGVNNVYATGIVSAIPTAYNTQYKNITFNLVDNSGDSVFLQAYRCGGTDAANVAVGDIAVVYGNLTKYNSTYEFGQGCTLVSLEHPVVSTTYEVTFDSNGGSNIPEGKDVGEGLTFQFPSAGTLADHIFLGWSSDGGEHYYQEGDTSVAVTDDIEYTAYWATKGAEADPYTVSEAIAAINGNYGLKNIYVSGIISQVDSFSSGVITYWISEDGSTNNQFEVYKGKNIGNENFTAKEDVEVGASVTVFGNIKKYNTTYEFDSGNYLVAYAVPSHPLTGIALSGTYQTSFEQGATFNYEGLVVTASYDGAADKEVTPTSVSSPDMNVLGEQEVTVSYTEEEVTKTASYTITVTAPVAKHTVSFNHGDGTGEMDSVLVNDGASFELPDCAFIAPEGKVFAGWSLNGTDKVTALESVTADVEVTALWEDAPDETTVSTTIEDYASANSWVNATQYSSVELDSNVVISVAGGANTGKFYDSGKNWRLYQGENATLTITANNGVSLVSVTIEYSVDKTGILLDASSNVYESGTQLNLNGVSEYIFSVGNTSTATNGQVRVTSIEVVYSGSATPQPAKVLTSISVSGAQSEFEVGDTFVYTGLVVTAHYENANDEEIKSGYTVNSDVVDNSKAGAYTVVVSYQGFNAEYQVTYVEATPAQTATYKKVKSNLADFSGEYLIVSEEEGDLFAFDGSLETLDAASNGHAVVIDDETISLEESYEFTIAKKDDGYSIKSASGLYIGQTSDANGLKSSENDDYKNAISYDLANGTMNIVCEGGAYLRYNANSGNDRFRFFKSSTYTGQKAVHLYQKVNEQEAFALDILNLTNDVCGLEQEHAKSDFAVSWSSLQTKYSALSDDAKAALVTAEADADGVMFKEAMARYDILVAKYGLDAIITSRATSSSGYHISNATDSSASTIIIVVVALTSITSIGVLLVIKRRRTLMK